MSVVDFFDLTGVLFYLRMSRSFLKLNPFMGRQPVIDDRLADRSKVNDAGFDVPDRQSKTLICPCSIQAHIIYHPPGALVSLPSAFYSMEGDNNKKTPYSHRFLAAIDSSIAASKDFVVGRGWSPLVNIGLIRIRMIII